MAFSMDVFQVIFFVLLLGIGSEIALYLWCYQSSSFKSINESIVKQSRKASALKGTPQYYKQRQNKKNDRFEAGLKKDATKELAVLKVKQSIVVSMLCCVSSQHSPAFLPQTTNCIHCRLPLVL